MRSLLRAGSLDVAGLLAAVADALLGDLGRAVAGKVTGLTAYFSVSSGSSFSNTSAR